MAVEAVYRSTRQPETLFMTRQEADRHDLMLEVAENLSSMFRRVLPNMSEDDAETLGIFMSERRDELAVGFKKNPGAILDLLKPTESVPGTVVPLANAS